jgi:hypothetical protein
MDENESNKELELRKKRLCEKSESLRKKCAERGIPLLSFDELWQRGGGWTIERKD